MSISSLHTVIANPSRDHKGAAFFDLDANDKVPLPYGHGSDSCMMLALSRVTLLLHEATIQDTR